MTWNCTFIEVDSIVVSWWIVAFLRCVAVPGQHNKQVASALVLFWLQ